MENIRHDPNYIRIEFPLGAQKSKCNPTPQQRAVYNFHEARRSNEALDIYASTWFERTENFLEHARPTAQSTVLKDWDMIRDLDFGEFYLAHPIAGYSLWQFIHACDELDATVSGSSKIESLLGLKPFQFLENSERQEIWRKSLDHVKKEVEGGSRRGEYLLQKLHLIFNDLEKLDSAFQPLHETFLGNLEGKYLADRMMKTICTAYDWRRQMIANLSLIDDPADVAHSSYELSETEDLTSSRAQKLEIRGTSRHRPKSQMKKKRANRRKTQSRVVNSPMTSSRASTTVISGFSVWPLLVLVIALALYMYMYIL
ncbi:uncharacterized protein LY89DRAFT_458131 [Mollisia scopiformis]|uniref:Uncharacterized protein n=1 Tax=Mollisia scopiformis TaxID=149040 RepID=A0A194XHR2_MOLSC|nr:uncharacterized protein LY89DRAFT_458131 [Mollisia scopiformis]KUJ19698.1 hypothetical protein LY89DRAFT_458131 [Mollisia scopiformis]